MILQALHQLYARLQDDSSYGMARPGRSIQKISFRIVLRHDGSLFEIQSVEKDGKASVQEEVLGTTKPSGPGINPCFLWDNATYLLGCNLTDSDSDRPRKSFEAFRDRHLSAENDIGVPEYSAVCRFLEQWQPENAAHHPVLQETATGFGVFQIIGEEKYVHHHPVIQEWWDRHSQNSKSNEGEVLGQCLISGREQVPIARLHPKIRGVPGGNPDKSLVGFKPDAFKSYGKDQSFNAPVGIDAAREYTAALNDILEGPRSGRHRFRLGDSTVVFWTERPTLLEDVFAEFALNGSKELDSEDGEVQDAGLRQKIASFLGALRKGIDGDSELASDDPDRTRFFILGLSANSARLAVRFFHQSTVRQLLDHLLEHQRHCGIERQYAAGSKNPDPEWPSLRLLLRQAAREPKDIRGGPVGGGEKEKRQTAREPKDIPPLLEGPLLDAVIAGGLYPPGLVTAVIRRIRADRRISYPRMFVIKGYLVRNLNKEVPMSLDINRTDPAYRLGRLFAVLEKIQKEAYKEQTGNYMDKTIKESYYGSASATPLAVFPRIDRLSTHHRRHLKPGRKLFFDRLIQEIFEPLDGFPSNLNLAEQGLFAIGYYHQTNAFYKTQAKEDI